MKNLKYENNLLKNTLEIVEKTSDQLRHDRDKLYEYVQRLKGGQMPASQNSLIDVTHYKS